MPILCSKASAHPCSPQERKHRQRRTAAHHPLLKSHHRQVRRIQECVILMAVPRRQLQACGCTCWYSSAALIHLHPGLVCSHRCQHELAAAIGQLRSCSSTGRGTGTTCTSTTSSCCRSEAKCSVCTSDRTAHCGTIACSSCFPFPRPEQRPRAGLTRRAPSLDTRAAR